MLTYIVSLRGYHNVDNTTNMSLFVALFKGLFFIESIIPPNVSIMYEEI